MKKDSLLNLIDRCSTSVKPTVGRTLFCVPMELYSTNNTSSVTGGTTSTAPTPSVFTLSTPTCIVMFIPPLTGDLIATKLNFYLLMVKKNTCTCLKLKMSCTRAYDVRSSFRLKKRIPGLHPDPKRVSSQPHRWRKSWLAVGRERPPEHVVFIRIISGPNVNGWEILLQAGPPFRLHLHRRFRKVSNT